MDPIYQFDVDHLPAFLSNHTLLPSSQPERLGEFNARWSQAVESCWGDPSQRPSTLGIVFDWGGTGGVLTVHLFARFGGGGATDPAPHASQIRATMRAAGLPLTDRGASAATTPAPLERAAARAHAYEVRQRETEWHIPVDEPNDRLTLAAPPTEGIKPSPVYSVQPLRGPAGTFLTPFEVMTAQAAPTSLVLLIEPTRLTEEERIYAAEYVKYLATLADFIPRGTPTPGRHDFNPSGGTVLPQSSPSHNPLAKWVADDFATHLRSIDRAFLTVAYALSDDERAAAAVAQALAGAAVAEVPAGTSMPSAAHALPCGRGRAIPRRWARRRRRRRRSIRESGVPC